MGSDRLIRLCSADDIPRHEGRSIKIGDKRVAVFNTAFGYVALDAVCPHKGGQLGDAIVTDTCIICPLHNWRISLITGKVIEGGEGQVHTYHVVEKKGILFISQAELG